LTVGSRQCQDRNLLCLLVFLDITSVFRLSYRPPFFECHSPKKGRSKFGDYNKTGSWLGNFSLSDTYKLDWGCSLNFPLRHQASHLRLNNKMVYQFRQALGPFHLFLMLDPSTRPKLWQTCVKLQLSYTPKFLSFT